MPGFFDWMSESPMQLNCDIRWFYKDDDEDGEYLIHTGGFFDWMAESPMQLIVMRVILLGMGDWYQIEIVTNNDNGEYFVCTFDFKYDWKVDVGPTSWWEKHIARWKHIVIWTYNAQEIQKWKLICNNQT